jgi:hypothetical protein
MSNENSNETNPEKQKIGAQKYSATPVSKPNRAVTKAGWDMMSVQIATIQPPHEILRSTLKRFLMHSIKKQLVFFRTFDFLG